MSMMLVTILATIFHFKPIKNTVHEAYSYAIDTFTRNKISEASASARYLICKAAGIGDRYHDFQQNIQYCLTPDQIANFNIYCNQRLKGEPIQYIVGDWDFYGLKYKLRRPILIPRPETEELVDYILKSRILTQTSKSKSKNIKIFDIGCGSGIIGITLLHSLFQNKNYDESTNALPSCLALDINPIAVNLSRENADNILQQYSSQYTCMHKSFLEFIKDSSNSYPTNLEVNGMDKFDIIVSNPPYIPSQDIHTLDTEVKVI